MEIYLYESSVACAVDALVIMSKSNDAKDLYYINDDKEVNELYELMRDGEATRQDIELISSNSVIWAAIMKLCSESKFFSAKVEIASFSSRFPSHIQRFLGALFSTIEYLVEANNNQIYFLINSLSICLFSNDPSDSSPANIMSGKLSTNVTKGHKESILYLIQEYRTLFPYCFMFYRRVGPGKSPKPLITLWTNTLNIENLTSPPSKSLNIDPQTSALRTTYGRPNNAISDNQQFDDIPVLEGDNDGDKSTLSDDHIIDSTSNSVINSPLNASVDILSYSQSMDDSDIDDRSKFSMRDITKPSVLTAQAINKSLPNSSRQSEISQPINSAVISKSHSPETKNNSVTNEMKDINILKGWSYEEDEDNDEPDHHRYLAQNVKPKRAGTRMRNSLSSSYNKGIFE